MIYLDHNATTQPQAEVVEAVLPFLKERWGNPSSVYQIGSASKCAIEGARDSVSSCLGADSESVIFTSGATESINAAIHSAIMQQPGKRHLVTSVVEHSATLSYCKYLEQQHGVEVSRIPVAANGAIDLDTLNEAIRDDTALVSLMWANNETGVVWPIHKISEICRDRGVLFHTDAVQAVGKLPVCFHSAGVDFLSLSGHKIGGLKGSGALLVKNPTAFMPLIYGGKQENGMRGGTESLPLIVGLGKAAEICACHGERDWREIQELRDKFEVTLLSEFEGALIHAQSMPRLPNTTSLHIPGLDGDAAVTFLGQRGICVSSGSACLESAIAPSHVISAMTQSHDVANETIRISLGLQTTQQELDELLAALQLLVSMAV